MLYVLAGLAAVLVLIAALLWRNTRRRRQHQTPARAFARTSPQAQLDRLRAAGRYWGISIESHCRASSTLAGSRFSFEQAPALPVPGCEAVACSCCLVGLPERRRSAERRSGVERRRSVRVEANDRRNNHPRRAADRNYWGAYGHL